jgi:hypothetical protein
MFFYLYRLTHKTTGYIYVGVHQTENLDDGYMGSGKITGKIIKEQGIDIFEKEIVEYFDNANAMFLRERELVNDKFLSRSDVYNIKPGGAGGNTLQGRKWYNNGITEKYFHENDVPPEWIRGRLPTCVFNSSELQRKLSLRADRAKQSTTLKSLWADGKFIRDHTKCGSKGDNNPSTRPEVRKLLSDYQKKRSETMVTCPHCGKIGKNSVGMLRFHFDKCRNKS